jgi:hypothetical protein
LDWHAHFRVLSEQSATHEKGHTHVSEQTRAHLLDFLNTVPDLTTSPYFSCAHLGTYLDLFFEHWNRIMPMIHRPSFRAADVCPALLAACVTMGTYFADLPKAAELGCSIAGKLWPAIVSLDNVDPQRITLELLQAMVCVSLWENLSSSSLYPNDTQGQYLLTHLAVDAYGTFCASRKLHEMADCFHPLIITFARRNALFDSIPCPSLGPSASTDPNVAWTQLIAHEEKIRVAHAIYVLDGLGAMLFGHQTCLSALQPNLALLADDAEWTQTSAANWIAFQANHSASASTEDQHGEKGVLEPTAIPHGPRTIPTQRVRILFRSAVLSYCH